VVEADEYDRSFLRLSPDIAVVTSMDADHLDIYGEAGKLKESFGEFVDRIRDKGCLVVNEKVSKELPEDKDVSRVIYGLKLGEVHAGDRRVMNGAYHFDVNTRDSVTEIDLLMPGNHNVENALAAVAVARKLRIPVESIRKGLNTFLGVRRRFEYILRDEEITYIDDYAHHPEEIRAVLSAVRELYAGKKITAVFQPHLYSRTRDFAERFGESLSIADEVILLPIYPAREQPIEGVESEMLLDSMTIKNKMVCRRNEVIPELNDRDLEVVVTLGAGDIDKMVEPIHEFLSNKYTS
jgi:UDP-N-acetylmuramate--alanine ligase